MAREFLIGKKMIGENHPILLIAEAGVNHNGEVALAKKLIDYAVKHKVDAIKFQTFSPEALLLKNTPKAEYQKVDNKDGENFFELIKRLTLTKNDFFSLKNYCDEKGILFLSTPFDESSVELLDEIKVPVFKIGSGDMNNYLLLKLICSKRKPIFLSTGMATLEEVKDSYNYIKSNKINEIVLFQCTTNYPSNYEELNLNVIETYRKLFSDCLIGFSDHSIGFEASIGAAAKGVKVIEKHFTLDKKMEGPDHKTSLDPIELDNWVKQIRNLEKSLGSFEKFPSENEIKIAKVIRKSIVSIKDIKKGEILNPNNIGIKRPGIGIQPKFFEKIIGKKAKENIEKDTIIKWEDLK